MESYNNQDKEDFPELPEHLKRWPGLYVRDGNRIVEASHRDIAVARSYARFQDKGAIVNGRRITILTENTTHRIADEARIIHVIEFAEPGYQAYIMGPKPIFGEYINDELVTEPIPTGDPLVPTEYSGVTLPSPAVDYNFGITSYMFHVPGIYRIQWKLGFLESNTLVVTIEPE
jgi:hypothetical protein